MEVLRIENNSYFRWSAVKEDPVASTQIKHRGEKEVPPSHIHIALISGEARNWFDESGTNIRC